MGRVAAGLPRARQGAGAAVPGQDARRGSRCARRRSVEVLQHDVGLADKRAFKRFIGPLRRSKWVVDTKTPFAGPEQVLRYLSRYTHRVAISNRRLVAADANAIAFRWKDYRIDRPGRWKTMRLHPHEFIRRFLMHVLPKGFHGIRHDGLFANGNRAESVATARELLDVAPRRRPGGAGGRRAGRARAAVTMPALRRSHDRHRGLRARLRAEIPADAGQDRHIMSQRLSISVAAFPFQMRWLYAGGDTLLDPITSISARIAR